MTCLWVFCFFELELELIQSQRTGANTIPDDTHTPVLRGEVGARAVAQSGGVLPFSSGVLARVRVRVVQVVS